jgi:hypothetical protein
MIDKTNPTEVTNLMKEAGYEWPFIVGVLESIIKTNIFYGSKMEPSLEYWSDRCSSEIALKNAVL